MSVGVETMTAAELQALVIRLDADLHEARMSLDLMAEARRFLVTLAEQHPHLAPELHRAAEAISRAMVSTQTTSIPLVATHTPLTGKDNA